VHPSGGFDSTSIIALLIVVGVRDGLRDLSKFVPFLVPLVFNTPSLIALTGGQFPQYCTKNTLKVSQPISNPNNCANVPPKLPIVLMSSKKKKKNRENENPREWPKLKII